MTGWRKRTIMEMAREAGFMAFEYPALIDKEDLKKLEAFANLVREDALAQPAPVQEPVAWVEYETGNNTPPQRTDIQERNV